jgi:hypothetical protein
VSFGYASAAWADRATVLLERTRREQLILILGLAKPLLFAVYADFADRKNAEKGLFYKVFLVPVERIELPTFGLQNRCIIAEAQPANKTRSRLRGQAPARHIGQPRMLCTACDHRGADVGPSWLHHG